MMYSNEFEGTSDVEVTYGNLEDKMPGKKKIGVGLAIAAGAGVGGYVAHDLYDVIPDLFRFPDVMDNLEAHIEAQETFNSELAADVSDLKGSVVDVKGNTAEISRDINVLDSKVDRLQDDHKEIIDMHEGTDTGDSGDAGGDQGDTGDTGGDGIVLSGDGPIEVQLGIYMDDQYGGDYFVNRSMDSHGDVEKFIVWNRDGSIPNSFIQDFDEFEKYFEGRYGGDWDYSSTTSQVTFEKK